LHVKNYSVSHLSDSILEQEMLISNDRDRTNMAELLARLAEFDARRLYVPAGYPSMHSYCVQKLHFSEDSARKRIHAARAARGVPAVLHAIAEGRLHLSGVVLLAPILTPENAPELLAAATHQTKPEIERLVAEWSPRLDEPELVQVIAEPPSEAGVFHSERAPGRVESASRGPIAIQASAPRPKVTPLSPGRYVLTLTMDQEMHDDLGYAQELLSHQIPSREVTKVLHRALKALIAKLEKRKFGPTDRPRQGRRGSKGARYIPAHVRRAVKERDGGRCTFVSESGHRCGERRYLEHDHVQPVARGGESTVENLRLRCRAHNQHGADLTFGAEFMRLKREGARRTKAERAQAAAVERARVAESEEKPRARAAAKEKAKAEARARAAAKEKAEAEAKARALAKGKAEEVIPWLEALGIKAKDARRAAERCEAIPEAPLEERIRAALQCFGARTPARAGVALASPGTAP
jgi:hypothetical protein